MKKRVAEKIVPVVIWILMLLLAADIVIKGLSFNKETWGNIMRNVQQQAIETYLPGIVEVKSEARETAVSWLFEKIQEQAPVLKASLQVPKEAVKEDEETSIRIVKENTEFLEEKLLEENQEAGPSESGYENTGGTEEEKKEEQKLQEQREEIQSAAVQHPIQRPVTEIPLEKMQDFDYVISNFYTVDKTTSMSKEQLDAPALVQMDMKMKTGKDKPQILIYHSHSQEAFIDSAPGDVSATIVGVGEYLTTLLRDTYQYQVIHVTDTFDIVDGKLDRNQAYTCAREKISRILEENPSIEVVIDLHRDGVAEDKRLVTDINGKQTAKIMFFNGLSRTRQNGDISYLPNPYIRENLAFSLQMMLESKKYYPELARTIYLRGYRYNLHLRPKTLLIECGAQTNTVQEEMNAMEPLADILDKVLS